MLRNHRMQVMRTIKHYKSDPGSYFIKKLLKLSYIQNRVRGVFDQKNFALITTQPRIFRMTI